MNLKIAVTIFLLTSCNTRFNCRNYIKTQIIPKDIHGVVVAKNKLKPCFGEIVLSNSESLKICTCSPSNFWKDVQIGDSVSKNLGGKGINLIRNSKKSVYDFPCCDW